MNCEQNTMNQHPNSTNSSKQSQFQLKKSFKEQQDNIFQQSTLQKFKIFCTSNNQVLKINRNPMIVTKAKSISLNSKAPCFFPNWLKSELPDPMALLKSIPKTVSDEGKIMKVSQLLSYVQFTKFDILQQNISKSFCSEILIQLGDFTSPLQFNLLRVCCIVAQRGAEMADQWEVNLFSQVMDQSGLYDRIERLTIDELINWSNNGLLFDQMSKFLSEIILTYSLLHKATEIGEENCYLLNSYFEQNFLKLYNCLSNQNSNNNQPKYIDCKFHNDELETEMRKCIRILKAHVYLTESDENQSFFISEYSIYTIIAPLLHISCPSELNCPQKIPITNTGTSYQFLGVVFEALAELAYDQNNIKLYLLQKHMVLEHLTSTIIPVVSNIKQLNINQYQIQQTPQTSSSIINPLHYLSLLVGALYFLRSILRYNQTFSEKIANIPKLIPSITTLIRSQLLQQEIMNKSFIAVNVWYHCSACLFWVRYYGNINVQNQLINQWRYLELQIEIGGTAGGSQIENTDIISYASQYIKYMIIDRREGTKWCIASSMLLQDAYEKIENSGGYEELDSLLYHRSCTINYDVRKSSCDTIYYLNNISTDRSKNF